MHATIICTVLGRVLSAKTVPNVVPTETRLPEGSNRTAAGADLSSCCELRLTKTVVFTHLDLLYRPLSSLSSRISTT